MSYDIHGNVLRSNHCEVHPYVHEQYPCSVCMREADDEQRLRREREKWLGEEYNRYCAEMQETESSEQQGLMGDGI